MSKILQGYILIFIAVVLWAIAGPIAKLLFTYHFDPFLVIQTRAIFSFIFLFLLILVINWKLLSIKKADIKYFAILGIIGMAGSNYFYYNSINYITVATAIMIQYTTPFIVMIYSFVLKLEKYNHLKIIALVFAFISLFFAISGGDFSYFSVNLTGILLSCAGALTWSFFNIYNKMIKNRYNNYSELLLIIGSGSFFWILINPSVIGQIFALQQEHLIVLFFFALLSVLIPMLCYNAGLKRLKATQATTIGLSEPVIVVFVAYFLLGERISLVQIISGTFVLMSIYLLEYIRKKEILSKLNLI